MQQIMHYDGEFRREEATSVESVLTRNTGDGSDRVEAGDQNRPPGMLDRPGGLSAVKGNAAQKVVCFSAVDLSQRVRT